MILDGKSISNIILDEIKEEVNKLLVKPKLVVIQIGEDAASNIYIKQKINMCNYVGYKYEYVKLDTNVDTDYVISIINKLNNDNNVTGILVQLPLSKDLDTYKIINTIDQSKDVDGLTDINCGKLFHNRDCLCSCTASGILELLKRYDIDVASKNVVIVSRSNIVGKPLALMMLNMDATVTVCHSKTNNLLEYTKNADILIVAVGEPNFIKKDMISDNTVVIDVGINYTGKDICGDVDFESVKDKASYISPVPGGVGPMTIACLAKNILKCYKIQNKEN